MAILLSDQDLADLARSGDERTALLAREAYAYRRLFGGRLATHRIGWECNPEDCPHEGHLTYWDQTHHDYADDPADPASLTARAARTCALCAFERLLVAGPPAGCDVFVTPGKCNDPLRDR